MQQQDYLLEYQSTEVERTEFFKKTYTHLAGALLAFMALEIALIKFVPENIIMGMMGSRGLWMMILVGFWLVGSISNKFAHSEDRQQQYLGLGLYVVVEAIIFLPLLYMVTMMTNGGMQTLNQALILTISLFAGLSAVAIFTKKDFSFLRSVLTIAGFVAIGLIGAGWIFGFDLGLWFSVGMVAVAGASILYQTSNLVHEYRTDQHVGAALGLFSSFMLLFWYVLRILSRR
jgi:FtsH-binding integral membrane protein